MLRVWVCNKEKPLGSWSLEGCCAQSVEEASTWRCHSVIKTVTARPVCLGLTPCSWVYYLCDLGQVTSRLWSLVSLLESEDENISHV